MLSPSYIRLSLHAAVSLDCWKIIVTVWSQYHEPFLTVVTVQLPHWRRRWDLRYWRSASPRVGPSSGCEPSRVGPLSSLESLRVCPLSSCVRSWQLLGTYRSLIHRRILWPCLSSEFSCFWTPILCTTSNNWTFQVSKTLSAHIAGTYVAIVNDYLQEIANLKEMLLLV